MPSTHAKSTWIRGGTHQLTTAKRDVWSLPQWAMTHIDAVLNGGSSTEQASGRGSPLSGLVSWTLDGEDYEVLLEVWGTQSDLDAAVSAMEDAIEAHGGTVTS